MLLRDGFLPPGLASKRKSCSPCLQLLLWHSLINQYLHGLEMGTPPGTKASRYMSWLREPFGVLSRVRGCLVELAGRTAEHLQLHIVAVGYWL